jgi:hypothetical protein
MICLVARWLKLSAEALDPIGFSAYTTGITVLQLDRHGSRIVERLNDATHLATDSGATNLGSLLT